MITVNAKSLLFLYLLFHSAYYSSISWADIYKGTDAKGNIYYSDQPIENSEKITPVSISVIGSNKSSVKATSKEQSNDSVVENYKYTKFAIVDPLQNQVIRNQSNISISLQIEPPLNVKANHKIWLLVDGKPVVKDSQVMSLNVGQLDRGAHKFQAQVKDESGKVIARTKTITAHIKQGAY